MGFEVPPVGVGPRGTRARAIAVVLASAALIGGAVVAAFDASSAPGPSTPPPAPAVSPALAAAPPLAEVPAPSPSAEPVERPYPRTVVCHGLGHAECSRIVVAALRELPGSLPVVISAAAWRSLLCDDTLECPPSKLSDHRPLGSVILAFGSGPSAWLDVVESEPHPGAAFVPTEIEAWIVRWG